MHANIGYALRRLDSAWSLGFRNGGGLAKGCALCRRGDLLLKHGSLLSQAGLRAWLVRDILQMYATYGYDFSSRDHF